MKILYCAYYLDPNDPDSGSGADYNFFHAICQRGHEVKLLGPIVVQPHFIERIIKRIYEKITRKKYIKYYISDIFRYHYLLKKELRKWTPDLIFSVFPVPFIFRNGKIPCVFRTDAPVFGVEKESVNYGFLARKVFGWVEKRAFYNVRYVITHSDWSKNIIVNDYHVDPNKVFSFPNPCNIKKTMAASEAQIQAKRVSLPLQLLAVGRNYHVKGIDIAIKTTALLNEKGYPTKLTICGMEGISETGIVEYMGLYRKKNTNDFLMYLSHYSKAHFFIHPTRFDPSPIVTSEAAAFGLPVITNLVGGMGTSVLDGKTGIVLPYKSSPEKYAEAIVDLYLHPDNYYELSMNALKRFQSELNWDDAGDTLVRLFELAIK